MPADARLVFKGVVFDVYQWEQELYDGSRATFEKLKRPDTVLVVPVLEDGNILMTYQEQPGKVAFRGFAGGRVEEGEEPEAAARRELLEETGLTAGELRPLWSGARPSEPGFPHRVTIHAFRGTTDARQEDVVLGEGKAMVFVPRDQVFDRDLALSAAVVLPLHLGAA